jgi:hypothetical protein
MGSAGSVLTWAIRRGYRVEFWGIGYALYRRGKFIRKYGSLYDLCAGINRVARIG